MAHLATLKYKRIGDAVPAPIAPKVYAGDAGWDLAIAETYTIRPGESEYLHTHIAVELERGFYLRITNRSSTRNKFGVTVHEGIIDNGWRGELLIGVTNISRRSVKLLRGQRVAQILMHQIYEHQLQEVDELSPSDRGTSGFGSTGTD